ncbi:hypothetical protein BGX38DRAFT_1180007 [Terfezia claveryi]|nr:hypothetical protein BGX38DRAFT_1180007 [Terfezia claveryi]
MGMGKTAAFQVSMYISNAYLPGSQSPTMHNKQYQCLENKGERVDITQLCEREERTWSSGHLMQLVGVIGCTSFATVGVQEEVYFHFNSINPRPEGFLCFSRTHGERKKTGGITLTLSPQKFKTLVSGLGSCQTRSGLCLEISQIHTCIRSGRAKGKLQKQDSWLGRNWY